MFGGVRNNEYLCRCNEDATATVGCGSAKAKRACLRVHLAPQLHPGKAQGGRRLAEVISRRKIKTTRNTFKKYD